MVLDADVPPAAALMRLLSCKSLVVAVTALYSPILVATFVFNVNITADLTELGFHLQLSCG